MRFLIEPRGALAAFVLVFVACSSADSAPLSPAAALDAGTDAPPPLEVLDQGIVSLSPNSSAEHEPHVTAGPTGRAVIAWIGRGLGVFHIGYRISNDAGMTWGPAGALRAPDGFSTGDPVAAADATGGLYLAWGTIKKDASGQRLEGHLVLSRSLGNSQTFDRTDEVTDPAEAVLYDQPRVLTKPSGGLLYTYTRYAKDLSFSAIMAATSSGEGAFTRTTVREDSTFRNLAFPCAARDSQRVYVRYFDEKDGVVLRRSEDGGATWPADASLAVADSGEVARLGHETPGCVARGDEIWTLYAVGDGGGVGTETDTAERIRLAHSSDRGTTIDWRADVHDPTLGKMFLFPEITLEDGGNIDVVYYAGQGPGDRAARLVWGRSTDGGRTFATTTIKEPLLFEVDRAKSTWIGDYIGLAWSAPNLYVAYTDTLTKPSAHTAFYRTSVPTP